jgi:hypothetical protein
MVDDVSHKHMAGGSIPPSATNLEQTYIPI